MRQGTSWPVVMGAAVVVMLGGTDSVHSRIAGHGSSPHAELPQRITIRYGSLACHTTLARALVRRPGAQAILVCRKSLGNFAIERAPPDTKRAAHRNVGQRQIRAHEIG